MKNCSTFYVGIDEHKDSLVVATASSNEPWCRPAVKLPNNIAKIVGFLKNLKKEGDVNVVYEAGPGGFVLQRELTKKGFSCQVPTTEQESTRTLVRCREDMSEDMR